MRRRLVIKCQWCQTECRGDGWEKLRQAYGRHLRGCGAMNASFVRGRIALGAPWTKEQVIDGILQRSGLSAEGQLAVGEEALKKLRGEISVDPKLTAEERAELLEQVDRAIGTPTHEATGKTLAPALQDVEVVVEAPGELPKFSYPDPPVIPTFDKFKRLMEGELNKSASMPPTVEPRNE